MPFAFMGAFLAARGWPSNRQIFWILVAMVGMRSAAMAFNRLVDADIDAANQRTCEREIPRGALQKTEVWAFVGLSSLVFILAAYQLNRLCFILSPLALVVTLSYSFSKRFTWLSHLILGGAIGLAPVGGWLAVAVPLLSFLGRRSFFGSAASILSMPARTMNLTATTCLNPSHKDGVLAEHSRSRNFAT